MWSTFDLTFFTQFSQIKKTSHWLRSPSCLSSWRYRFSAETWSSLCSHADKSKCRIGLGGLTKTHALSSVSCFSYKRCMHLLLGQRSPFKTVILLRDDCSISLDASYSGMVIWSKKNMKNDSIKMQIGNKNSSVGKIPLSTVWRMDTCYLYCTTWIHVSFTYVINSFVNCMELCSFCTPIQ